MLNRFLQRAPKNFLSREQIQAVRSGRRGSLAGAVAAAAGAIAADHAVAQGDPAILNLPAHSKGLGQPVAARGYGLPSEWEKNLQRRESPGLTRVAQSSVSFAPLQGLFGIITPSGLHFERHHQGWWDIDPSQHRLMINGSDDRLLKRPMVFSMDELMRLPSVSRMHFIECGANTGMEWGNVAVPTVQYTHGMLSCSEFTGVPLRTLLELCGADFKRARFVLAEGADGSGMTRTIPMSTVLDGPRCWWLTARTANCCALKTVTRCAWLFPACRASAGSNTCAASNSVTCRMAPRTKPFTTSI